MNLYVKFKSWLVSVFKEVLGKHPIQVVPQTNETVDHELLNLTHETFKELIEAYDLTVKSEWQKDFSFFVEYTSKYFVLKLVTYHREIYATLHKLNDQKYGIDLFNLLEYLKQGESSIPQSDYFRKERDLVECYKKQLVHISRVVYDNYDCLIAFFNDTGCNDNFIEFDKFWRDKHPELYSNDNVGKSTSARKKG